METTKVWYAVMLDYDDDWGTGSYDWNEAVDMLKQYVGDGYSEALIAVIEEGNDPICLEEYRLVDVEDEE